MGLGHIAKTLRQGDWIDAYSIRVFQIVFLIAAVLMITSWVVLMARPGPAQLPGVNDFISVYAAGKATLEGRFLDMYDTALHKHNEHMILDSLSKGNESGAHFVPWLYPPIFLFVSGAVAFLPYFWALGLYSLLGVVAYVVAVRKLGPAQKGALLAIAVCPGVLTNLYFGQNGSFTTALLAAGLFLLDKSPILAGIAFGALAYKPQFFVLVPLALFAGRYWKALATTLLSAAAFSASSVIVFGPEAWMAFIRYSQGFNELLELSTPKWLALLHSSFSMVRSFGISIEVAYGVQIAVALGAAAMVVWLWRKRASFEVRGAALATGCLLASPYFLAYDELLLAIPIALLVREGLKTGFLLYEKTFLCALWALPGIVQDPRFIVPLPITPPMLMGLMFLCWKRSRGTPSCDRAKC